MTHEEIITMARDAAKASEFFGKSIEDCTAPVWLEQFAALVAAKDRERLAADVELPEDLESHIEVMGTAQLRAFICDYGDRRAAAEREECAKLIEEYPHWIGNTAKREISDAIREKKNK